MAGGHAAGDVLTVELLNQPAMTSHPHPQPFAEPWSATAVRTGSLAVGIGIGVGLYERRLAAIPLATVLALWFTLGGHFLEILFRNRLRQRLGALPPVSLAIARLVCWFVGGTVLYAGALATRALVTGWRAVPWPWWIGGVLFVAMELFIHLLLRARRQPSLYDGRG